VAFNVSRSVAISAASKKLKGRGDFKDSAKVSRFAKPRSDAGGRPSGIVFESLFVRRSRDRLDCDRGFHHRLVSLWDANTRTTDFIIVLE
jgi:hypothetical protein